MAKINARRFALALLKHLEGAGDVDHVLRDLEALQSLLSGLRALGRVLMNPALEAGKRAALLDDLIGKIGGHAVSRGAFELLAEHRLLPSLPDIIRHYRRLREERLGITSVQLTSATPIGEGERTAWEKALAKLAGTPVRVDYRTDSGLVGGAVARIGSTLYDGSVKGSLNRIRQSLLGE